MSFRAPDVGNKPLYTLVTVKNAEASAAIPNGVPVCLVMNGTDDGLAVVLPNTATASKGSTLFQGICYNPGGTTLPVGALGQAIVGGLALNVRVTQVTRATTTDSWATFSAIAVGDILIVDTVGNGLSRSTSGLLTHFAAYAVAGAVLASGSGSASASTLPQGTALAFTQILPKVIIRVM